MRLLSTAAITLAAFLLLANRELVAAEDSGEPKKSLEDVLKPAIEAHHGDVGIAVKHLKTGESYEYKADRPMPTASLVKLPVMIATYEAVDKEKLSLAELIELKKADQVPGSGILTSHFSPGTKISLRDAIRLMIVYSDNTATNLVLDKLGLPATNECMERLGCPDTKINSKVFRADTSIAKDRSKQFGLGSTSARDMVKLCEMLHDKKVVNEKACKQMMDNLYACDDKLKVPRLLPPGTKVAHKTGSVNSSRTDAGIIDTPSGPISRTRTRISDGPTTMKVTGSAPRSARLSTSTSIRRIKRRLRWSPRSSKAGQAATWSRRCSGRSMHGSSRRPGLGRTAILVRRRKMLSRHFRSRKN
jgi:beta-lactamase class A